MGLLLNGLEGHEGTARPRPTTTHTTSTSPTPGSGPGDAPDGQPRSYVAGCSCGWQAAHAQPPTLAGHQAAREAWLAEHAGPALAAQADTWRWELGWWLRLASTHIRRLEKAADLNRLADTLAEAQRLVAALQQAGPGRARVWETDLAAAPSPTPGHPAPLTGPAPAGGREADR